VGLGRYRTLALGRRSAWHTLTKLKENLRSPFLFSTAIFLGIPTCHFSFSFASWYYTARRATTADIVVAFKGTMWAYQSVDCTRLLLKPTKGMYTWRKWAQSLPAGAPPAVVADIPVVIYKQGVEVLGRDASGCPRDLSETFNAGRKRAARHAAFVPSPTPALPLRDAQGEPSSSADTPVDAVLPGIPSFSQPDVQITLGLDKGGDLGAVMIVATIIDQTHPNCSISLLPIGNWPRVAPLTGQIHGFV